jgi:hypothetical protein
MWIVLSRGAPIDMPYWPGRRLLATIDAVAWPFLWIAVLRHLPTEHALIAPVVSATALLVAIGRVRNAVWRNERYCFTTWRWGRILFGLIALGLSIKVMVALG